MFVMRQSVTFRKVDIPLMFLYIDFIDLRINARTLQARLESYKCTYYTVKTNLFLVLYHLRVYITFLVIFCNFGINSQKLFFQIPPYRMITSRINHMIYFKRNKLYFMFSQSTMAPKRNVYLN